MKPFEGQAIKPHVGKLLEAFKPKEGDVFLHQDIAHASGVPYRSARYGGVIVAWKKALMREANVDLEAIPGIGYRCLSDNERVSVGIKDFSHSVRRMGKSAERIARADTAKLDDNHRRQQDHAGRLMQNLVETGRKASKQISLAGRVVSLPRKKEGESA